MGAQPIDHVYPRQLDGIPFPSLSTSTSASSSASSSTSSLSSSTLAKSSTSPSTTASSTSVSSSSASTSGTPTSSESSTSTASSAYVHTSTIFVDQSHGVTPTASSNVQNTSFLQNKVASGVVFSLVGVIGLILIVFIATFFIRRRRNKRLLDEAVSFDPVTADVEKGRQSSSLGHGSVGGEFNKPPVLNHYAPSTLHYVPPSLGYDPRHSVQAYTPHPAGWSSQPTMMMQQHIPYGSAGAGAMPVQENANHSRPNSEMMISQVPEDIRRRYD